jgi:hypothetical protein
LPTRPCLAVPTAWNRQVLCSDFRCRLPIFADSQPIKPPIRDMRSHLATEGSQGSGRVDNAGTGLLVCVRALALSSCGPAVPPAKLSALTFQLRTSFFKSPHNPVLTVQCIPSSNPVATAGSSHDVRRGALTTISTRPPPPLIQEHFFAAASCNLNCRRGGGHVDTAFGEFAKVSQLTPQSVSEETMQGGL